MNIRKIIVLLVMSCVLCSFSPDQSPTGVRMMTYNVKNCTGIDGLGDLEKVAGAIFSVQPDVVAVQELDSVTSRSKGRFVLQELAERLDMHYVFAPAIPFQGGGYGIGILSKEKPLSVRKFPLPGREEKRMLLVAEFRDFVYACTHLSLIEADQQLSVHRIVSALSGWDKPVFLAGDMNSVPESLTQKMLSEYFLPVSHVLDLTFPAHRPDRCLDYIYLLKKGRGYGDIDILDQQVLRKERKTSDHLPVYADLSLRPAGSAPVLEPEQFRTYVQNFNAKDQEIHRKGEFSNDRAWEFLSQNIPLFECPDKQLETTYYFRWWTYRKHIRKTPAGYIITEFLPDVPWAGLYNSISCPAAQHFMEGRWLKNPVYLEEYARFWMNGKSSPRAYSFWVADAVLNYTYVHPNPELLEELFPALEKNFQAWVKDKMDSTGLFWQKDDRDGMEVSISGSYAHSSGRGYRATINSYMYAEASALAEIARRMGDADKSRYYRGFADALRTKMNTALWDEEAEFYKVIPRGSRMLSDARELHGYTPWYFNIPEERHSAAWKFIMQPGYFYAPYGLTTAEQCHPLFRVDYKDHECQWNGPVWPYSTSITLTAMANLLNNYQQKYVTARDYYTLLTQYSRMHSIDLHGNGDRQPWIDENMNPYTGDWISRTRLKSWDNGNWNPGKGGIERGKDYNHSSFNDLVITGLVGIRPSGSSSLTVNPLVPRQGWDYFCLDRLYYRHHEITVLYDRYGTRYGKGKGYRIYVDGILKEVEAEICKKTIHL